MKKADIRPMIHLTDLYMNFVWPYVFNKTAVLFIIKCFLNEKNNGYNS